MKKVPINTTKKGNPTPKRQAGGSTKVPAKPPARPLAVTQPIVVTEAAPVPDAQTERQPDPVPESSTDKPTTATKATHDTDAEAIMEDFMQKFGSKEEVMEFFPRFSSLGEKREPAQTTFTAPPQPSISEDTTAHIPTFHTGDSQGSTDAPAQSQPHAEAVQSWIIEEAGTEEEDGGEDGSELVEGMQWMVVEEQEASTGKEAEGNDDKGNEPEVGVDVGGIETVEGEAPIVDDDKGETPEIDDVKGETPVADDVEGETPMFGENIEEETPVFDDVKGETPRKVVEGETQDELVEGETPVVFADGETPGKVVEGETPDESVEGKTPVGTEVRNPNAGRSPIATEVEEPESCGLKEIVDLVEVPVNEDTPIRRREARRMARRSRLLDEEDDPTQPRRLEFNALGAGVGAEEEAPGSEDELEEAQRRRLAAERKRKGKQAAQAPPKRSRKTPLPSKLRNYYRKPPRCRSLRDWKAQV